MRSRIYRAGWKLLDLLFPPSCAGCGAWGEKYCPACRERTLLIENPICQICGDPLENGQQVICSRCRNSESAFSAVRSWAYFQDPLQSAIHKLKYRGDIGLGAVLAAPLRSMLEQYGWQVDLVVPVPLGPVRLRQRGYNQAALLARPLCWETGLDYLPNAVSRVRETRQQVGLSREERAVNMTGAFLAQEKAVADRSVLLIDDVITTGSTLNACAQSLMKAGAKAVFGGFCTSPQKGSIQSLRNTELPSNKVLYHRFKIDGRGWI
jgi:competence protein ComFC